MRIIESFGLDLDNCNLTGETLLISMKSEISDQFDIINSPNVALMGSHFTNGIG